MRYSHQLSPRRWLYTTWLKITQDLPYTYGAVRNGSDSIDFECTYADTEA